MRQETLEKLRNIYCALPVKGKETALKQHYQYNGVHVNVYVDFWDPKCPVLQLVLVLQQEEAETIYYLQAVSVYENGSHKTYLEELNPKIRYRLLDEEGSLKKFYADMDRRLMENRVYPINILEEKLVVETAKRQKDKIDIYPYLKQLRRDNMTPEHFGKLRDVLSIPAEILVEIKKGGYTVVTTPDPEKRVSLEVLLKGKVNIVK